VSGTSNGVSAPTQLGPDFLIIGAARGGTSAFASFVSEHPDVEMTKPKEPHFLALHGTEVAFNGPSDESMINAVAITQPDRWQALFAAPQAQVIGEGSVSTLYFHDRSIPLIKRYTRSDIPLFVLLRDPVERAYSSYLYMVARGHEKLTFADALADEDRRVQEGWHHIWHYRRMSEYVEQLEPFVDEFGDRLEVIISENFRSDPSPHLRRFFERVGVEPIGEIDTERPINVGGVPRSRLATSGMNVLRRVPLARHLAKRAVGHHARERWRAANLTRPDMPVDARRQLTASFTATCFELEQLLDRRLPWSHRS
jgi:hypothetical protein